MSLFKRNLDDVTDTVRTLAPFDDTGPRVRRGRTTFKAKIKKQIQTIVDSDEPYKVKVEKLKALAYDPMDLQLVNKALGELAKREKRKRIPTSRRIEELERLHTGQELIDALEKELVREVQRTGLELQQITDAINRAKESGDVDMDGDVDMGGETKSRAPEPRTPEYYIQLLGKIRDVTRSDPQIVPKMHDLLLSFVANGDENLKRGLAVLLPLASYRRHISFRCDVFKKHIQAASIFAREELRREGNLNDATVAALDKITAIGTGMDYEFGMDYELEVFHQSLSVEATPEVVVEAVHVVSMPETISRAHGKMTQSLMMHALRNPEHARHIKTFLENPDDEASREYITQLPPADIDAEQVLRDMFPDDKMRALEEEINRRHTAREFHPQTVETFKQTGPRGAESKNANSTYTEEDRAYTTNMSVIFSLMHVAKFLTGAVENITKTASVNVQVPMGDGSTTSQEQEFIYTAAKESYRDIFKRWSNKELNSFDQSWISNAYGVTKEQWDKIKGLTDNRGYPLFQLGKDGTLDKVYYTRMFGAEDAGTNALPVDKLITRAANILKASSEKLTRAVENAVKSRGGGITQDTADKLGMRMVAHETLMNSLPHEKMKDASPLVSALAWFIPLRKALNLRNIDVRNVDAVKGAVVAAGATAVGTLGHFTGILSYLCSFVTNIDDFAGLITSFSYNPTNILHTSTWSAIAALTREQTASILGSGTLLACVSTMFENYLFQVRYSEAVKRPLGVIFAYEKESVDIAETSGDGWKGWMYKKWNALKQKGQKLAEKLPAASWIFNSWYALEQKRRMMLTTKMQDTFKHLVAIQRKPDGSFEVFSYPSGSPLVGENKTKTQIEILFETSLYEIALPLGSYTSSGIVIGRPGRTIPDFGELASGYDGPKDGMWALILNDAGQVTRHPVSMADTKFHKNGLPLLTMTVDLALKLFGSPLAGAMGIAPALVDYLNLFLRQHPKSMRTRLGVKNMLAFAATAAAKYFGADSNLLTQLGLLAAEYEGDSIIDIHPYRKFGSWIDLTTGGSDDNTPIGTYAVEGSYVTTNT